MVSLALGEVVEAQPLQQRASVALVVSPEAVEEVVGHPSLVAQQPQAVLAALAS